MGEDTALNPCPGPSEPSFKQSDMHNLDDEFNSEEEICRVCRVAGDGPLYHPCLCAGSIKYVHQECLLQWLKYSKKEVCELCNHKFCFQPVYSPNMPPHLPVNDIVKGVFLLMARFMKKVLTMLFVMFCWTGLVPLIASRTHQIVFSGLISSIFSARILTLFSAENILVDVMRGWIIMSLFVASFIALVWLREQVNIIIQQDANAIPVQAVLPEPNPELAQRARQELQGGLRALLIDEDQVDEPNENADPNPELAQQPDPANVNIRQDQDQFVENMTWQRLLGLDGSFAFVENVFWVISLNFGFHVIFLLGPSIIGNALLNFMNIGEQITYFKTAINIFFGYIGIVHVIYIFHCLFKIIGYHSLTTLTHVTYLVIKVILLIITELVMFPILCGCWLDLCSLSLTGSTMNSRIKTFHSYPVSSTVLHWLAGMLYVFYSASFILALRHLLRPGVLWFIRNLNDPDFSPITEMLTHPIQKHCRRLVASTTLFLSIIFLVVYCPLRIIKVLNLNVVPYILSASEGQFGGFSLEIMLLQIVLPSTLEYMRAFDIMKYLIRRWCIVVGGMLQLDSYLLAKKDREPQEEPNELPAERPPQANNLGELHQALLVPREAPEHESYCRPDHFYLRLVALLICVAITSVIVSLIVLTVPVTVGRFLLIFAGVGSHSIHDIYSIAIGFYACWLFGKICMVSAEFLKKGRDYIKEKLKVATSLLVRIILAFIPVFGVIPILLSIYFQLLIIGPLRVSISQTPIFFVIKEWGMGILHLKIICASLMMGPDWWLKLALEQVYANGIRGINLRDLYIDIVLPVINTLTMLIVAPYICVRAVLMCMDVTPEDHATVVRYSYPSLLVFILALMYLRWAYIKLCSLYTTLKDEKYRIGTQLVNFYREGTINPATS